MKGGQDGSVGVNGFRGPKPCEGNHEGDHASMGRVSTSPAMNPVNIVCICCAYLHVGIATSPDHDRLDISFQ